ncbi:plasminogen-binding N-terminal domain-containing protein [Helicobacter winghamensis]|uniref:Plasminogen-binding protein pgbA n=1 Tax=Helicobacter winghamensis TaxID=157268 RepID=A0A2N3PLN1_9HELI|nr:plasminogen-binding N-terminal domain-containing protein [Helicobacter winghamensis]PKT75260.1 plasminogen-binding protein pgbA [Helicobacter winghamensis]PKT82756.1 plasminogen-binding protein pgbA [Helicobacter winghamensis]PKT82892.1 plasminogen-binding protein pgbA [Helicobacter winghamensis]
MKFLNSFQYFLKYSLFLVLFNVFSYASPFGNKLIVPIAELDEDFRHYAYVPAFDLKVGESGEIVRWFTKEHSAIVARAAVVEIKDNRAKIAFEPFEGLEQGAFPAPILYPKKNDEVIFRAFNDRAFLVAPSQEIYEKIKAVYPDVTWLHPDLLATYLMDVGHTSPVKGDFRRVCTQYAAGIVYLVNLNEGQALDCQTFKPVKKDYITGRAPINERMLPFFSRIGSDNQAWFSYLINDVTTQDYYLYFDALLKGEIKDEDATFFGRVTRYFTNQIKNIF